MKAIRTSVYPPGGDFFSGPEATFVTTENDITVSAEVFVEEMEHVDPMTFAIVEPFDVPTDDIVVATTFAMQRAAAKIQDEANMAILFYYDAHTLNIVAPGGILSTSQPSPLRRDQIEYVGRMLQRHPNYRHQTIIVHDENNVPVTIKPEGAAA